MKVHFIGIEVEMSPFEETRWGVIVASSPFIVTITIEKGARSTETSTFTGRERHFLR
jgi:hypothetical protein